MPLIACPHVSDAAHGKAYGYHVTHFYSFQQFHEVLQELYFYFSFAGLLLIHYVKNDHALPELGVYLLRRGNVRNRSGKLKGG